MKHWVLFLALGAAGAQANDLAGAEADQKALQADAKRSQQQVTGHESKRLTQQSELERLEEETAALEVYRNHLQSLVADQQRELDSLARQLAGLESTREGLVPLMYQMLNDLQQLVAADMPIRAERRTARLEELTQLMGQADVADAEKFRRLLEAYQIEMEYGRRLGGYRAQLALDGGDARQLEFAHLGRLALLARTPDGSQYWQWRNGQWQPLANGDEYRPLFDMALGGSTPSLLTLPTALEQ